MSEFNILLINYDCFFYLKNFTIFLVLNYPKIRNFFLIILNSIIIIIINLSLIMRHWLI